jgi:hypothetical protein
MTSTLFVCTAFASAAFASGAGMATIVTVSGITPPPGAVRPVTST